MDGWNHRDLPDEPFVESERRQILFGTAIGIPEFYVRRDTANKFLLRILRRTHRVRQSRRHPGYLRAANVEYQLALVDILEEDRRAPRRRLVRGSTGAINIEGMKP